MPPAAPAPSAPAPTVPGNPSALQFPEQLVIEGSLTAEVTEVGDLISALRTVVEAAGGRVIEETVSGGETSVERACEGAAAARAGRAHRGMAGRPR